MGRLNTKWVNAGLLNLCIVALLGFILRTKILFPIHFIDYRNILTAHGNFALAGWIGFVLLGFLVHILLPPATSGKRIYHTLFTLWFVFSWSMMLSFAISGPVKLSFAFSFLLLGTTYVFAWVFIRDILSTGLPRIIKGLSVLSLVSLVLASFGTIALVLMYMGIWQIEISYRDASYIFLHFQYNGFFSMAIAAIFLRYIFETSGSIPFLLRKAARWIGFATIPSVFLSLLYYERISFYVIGGITGLMLFIGACYLVTYLFSNSRLALFTHSWARALWIMAAISFVLKIIMQLGTLTPIGHEVYSDRPVIIGFLHMVFLGFCSFFILGLLVEKEFFSRKGKLIKFPLFVFILGVLSNETFLMIQGIEILLKTNNPIHNWLLWIAAIFLFSGALLIGMARIRSDRMEK